jgi:hypothetical protein
MNPLDWLKAIYETFGMPYPRASFLVVTLLGAGLFAGTWMLTAKQVEKDHKATSDSSGAQSQPKGATTNHAITSGPQSPAITGHDNQVQYENALKPNEHKVKPHSKE